MGGIKVIQKRNIIFFRSAQMNEVFGFDNGRLAILDHIPLEFRPLFNAIPPIAINFQSLIDWDVSSFVSLLVLQYLYISSGNNLKNFNSFLIFFYFFFNHRQ